MLFADLLISHLTLWPNKLICFNLYKFKKKFPCRICGMDSNQISRKCKTWQNLKHFMCPSPEWVFWENHQNMRWVTWGAMIHSTCSIRQRWKQEFQGNLPRPIKMYPVSRVWKVVFCKCDIFYLCSFNPISIWLLWFRAKTMQQIKGKRTDTQAEIRSPYVPYWRSSGLKIYRFYNS